MGASDKSDQDTHEQRPLAGSAVPVGIPSAVVLWHPIVTAPKDGRTLLLCLDPFVPATGHWTELCEDDGGCWTTACPTDFESEDAFRDYLASTFYTPTHWSPLPLTPSELAQAMDAGTAETEGLGSKDESAVAKPGAQPPPPSPSNRNP